MTLLPTSRACRSRSADGQDASHYPRFGLCRRRRGIAAPRTPRAAAKMRAKRPPLLATYRCPCVLEGAPLW